MSERNDIIKLWKENNLTEARFIFTAGGDSMGDTEWEFSNANGDCSAPKEIEDYLEDMVYDRVEFYVNSDGHYMGEAGTVTVTLENDSVDEDEEAWDFCLSKTAQSEWSESHTSEVRYALDEDEVAFVTAHVLNINGGEGNEIAVNFKHDFLMSDDEEQLLEELKENIEAFVRDFQPENAEGELQDWYTFTTNTDGDNLIATELTVEGNNLILYINNSMTVYKDDL